MIPTEIMPFLLDVNKVVRSGDLISYCAEEGVRILGQGTFLVSDSFPGNERTKYCLTSKVKFLLVICSLLDQVPLIAQWEVTKSS